MQYYWDPVDLYICCLGILLRTDTDECGWLNDATLQLEVAFVQGIDLGIGPTNCLMSGTLICL